jgi:ABC-type Fe3+/spermidine/putrescine transport system ATPase subunit
MASSGGAGDVHIEVKDLVVQYGHVTAVRGVSFAVRPGEQLTLLGPSGCGKTTTLRAIAGLEPPTSGEIVIGGAPVFSSAKRINVSAERRGLSMVFQSYAIWPHMTVFDNVAYGLRVRRLGAREIADKVRWALEMVQMGDFAERSASKLSGGQQQRVALARAFVFSPSVLLFDEPLSNLDAKLREEMRIELRELQHRVGITSVYVTHDLEEALAISDRIVVMRDGAIEQIGTPFEIYNFPRDAFGADFVRSANLIRGRHRPECAQGRADRAGDARRYARVRHDARAAGGRRWRFLGSDHPPGTQPRGAGSPGQRVAGAHPPARVSGGPHPVPCGLGGSPARRPLHGHRSAR